MGGLLRAGGERARVDKQIGFAVVIATRLVVVAHIKLGGRDEPTLDALPDELEVGEDTRCML